MRTLMRIMPVIAVLVAFCGPALPQAAVTYTYDTLGRVRTATYPGGKQIVYTYDAAGNRTQMVVSASTVNRPPVAVDDAKTASEGVPYTFDPRTNDSDPDGNPITITNVSNGVHGTATVAANGTSITYTATKGRVGSDRITYSISDGQGMTASAGVAITIANGAPVAVTDSLNATENQTTGVTIDPRANDTDPGQDPLTIVAKTNGTKGTVTIAADGTSVTYLPTATKFGSDTFTYTINDDVGGAATGTVNVSIASTNQAPSAVADSRLATKNQALTFDPRTNDTDPDNDALIVSAKTNGTKGTVAIGGGGTSVTYTPNTNALGADSFTYTIADPENATSTATVSMTIQDVNTNPTAANDGIGMYLPTSSVTFDPRWNDTDADGDPLTITAKTNGTDGSVTIGGGGTTLTYTRTGNFPTPQQTLTDTFTYTVSDGRGGTATATVTATITDPTCNPICE